MKPSAAADKSFKSFKEILEERGIDKNQLYRELGEIGAEEEWEEFARALEELPSLKGQPTWLKLAVAFLWGMATVSSLASLALVMESALSGLAPWEAQA
ncbi:MAG: hypothetical protein DRG40_02020 [Deltaproteobacteria bacterium]|nr:MAG: hypothetical protein DRG40_02020 [Deltaproteobacteria bacterium]